MQDRIEILPVTLLDQHRPLVNELKKMARALSLDFGWHYLLDLTWIISHLDTIAEQRILDAGAGTGVLQWYLAQQGAEVISVDRTSRALLPLRFRARFNITGMRPDDLASSLQALRAQWQKRTTLRARAASYARDLIAVTSSPRAPGHIVLYNQDLKTLSDVADNSLDAVVAVSALEHNEPPDLPLVVKELLRVLKPGGVMLATLGAAKDRDWFHKPSQGWCYTEDTLRRAFDLSPDAPSNYNRYDELFAALRACAELRESLAAFYHRSGDNGMPWGIWDPQYQSVGVLKYKS